MSGRRRADDEGDLYRRERGGSGLPLFEAEGEPTARLTAAVAGTLDSGLATEHTLVDRIQSMLRARHEFTADDVADLLDAADVPHLLATRRRLTSAIVNGGRAWWHPDGHVMTRRPDRSGRTITRWAVTAVASSALSNTDHSPEE